MSNEILLDLESNAELFGKCPQVGDKVFANVRGQIVAINAEMIDLGDEKPLPGRTHVSVLVLEVTPS